MGILYAALGVFLVVALSACAAPPDIATDRGNLPPAARQPATLLLDLGDGVRMELVLVPAGRFTMGSPETEEKGDLVGTLPESPPREVDISASFYLGKYEVTNAQFRRFQPDYSSGSNNRIDYPWGSIEGIDLNGDDQPVTHISLQMALAFCEWLSERSGVPIRLPAETEWEYACRARTTTPFHFGATISTDQANYDGRFTYGSGPPGEWRTRTTVAGKFDPNAFGLYDMHGNVWEWCFELPLPNTPAPVPVVRGGSWGVRPGSCRSAIRFAAPLHFQRSDFGFRVAASEHHQAN